MSSARTNDGWLSEEVCREGASICSPFVLARLRGREKLNAGLGRRVPPVEISELIEGDLGIELYIVGDIGDVEKPLPEDNFRWGAEVGPGY